MTIADVIERANGETPLAVMMHSVWTKSAGN